MKSEELVGLRGFWYFISSTRRLRKALGCKRLVIPVLSAAPEPDEVLLMDGVALVELTGAVKVVFLSFRA